MSGFLCLKQRLNIKAAYAMPNEKYLDALTRPDKTIQISSLINSTELPTI
jgi:hypothetical protein